MTALVNKKKILLLVGGSGFLGSAIGERFTDLGWDIRLLTRKKNFSKLLTHVLKLSGMEPIFQKVL